jgi:ribosomal protein S18 acetylase RimI-like enzyme
MLRIATEADVATVSEMLKDLVENSKYKSIFSTMANEEVVKEYVNQDTLNDRICFILEVDDKVAGFVACEAKPCVDFKVAQLTAIYLKPEFRKQGHAKTLMEVFEAWGKKIGSKLYYAGVSTGADLAGSGYTQYEVLYMKEVI